MKRLSLKYIRSPAFHAILDAHDAALDPFMPKLCATGRRFSSAKTPSARAAAWRAYCRLSRNLPKLADFIKRR